MAIKDKPPFDTVVTHGWVLDETGQSMHKSLGNVTSPAEIVEEFGADVLRLWIASVDWTQDVRYGREAFQRLVDAYRKIRNSFRFMLGNTNDFKTKDLLSRDKLLPIDKYILIEFNNLIKTVDMEYESISYHRAYRAIYNFIVSILSSFYLDILKDRLYVEGKNSYKRRSAQSVLYNMTKNLAIILAPILSFTCEEVWQTLFPGDSVFLNDFPDYYKLSDEDLELKSKFDKLLKVREEFHKVLEPAQEDNFIGNSLEASVQIKSNIPEIVEFEEYLPELFIVSAVNLLDRIDAEYTYDGEFGSYGVTKAKGVKCKRCWIYSISVGNSKEYPELCDRCIAVVKGGEFD